MDQLPGCATSVLEINLRSVCDNYKDMSDMVSPGKLACVVKADCYSLGSPEVARALYSEGCREFFVAYIQEAIRLRECGSLPRDSRIYVLSGPLPGSEELYTKFDLIPVIGSIDQINRWNNLYLKNLVSNIIVIHIDTAMARTGFEVSTLQNILHESNVKHESNVNVDKQGVKEILGSMNIQYVMTHFSRADEVDKKEFSYDQYDRFVNICEECFPGIPLSVANSYGLAMDKKFHHSMARTGLALYALAFDSPPLRVPVTLSSKIVEIRNISSNQPVGYNATYYSHAPRRLATLGIGHADGLYQANTNSYFVLRREENGYKVPIVGLISMDFMVVDVTDVPVKDEELLYSWVTLFHDFESVARFSTASQVSRYQTLTHLHFHRAFKIYYLPNGDVDIVPPPLS